MRKLAVSGIALALALGVTACGGDDDDSAGGGGDFCDKARTYEEKYADELDPSDDEALADLRDMASSAPSEIRDDVEAVIEAFEAFVAAGDDPEAQAALIAEFEDVEAQSARVTEYLEQECGINDESDDTGDTDSDDIDSEDTE